MDRMDWCDIYYGKLVSKRMSFVPEAYFCTLGNVWRREWSICKLALGCKGWKKDWRTWQLLASHLQEGIYCREWCWRRTTKICQSSGRCLFLVIQRIKKIATQPPDAGCHIGIIVHRSSMEAKMFSSHHWYPSGHNSES